MIQTYKNTLKAVFLGYKHFFQPTLYGCTWEQFKKILKFSVSDEKEDTNTNSSVGS
jgi:hypothetical protein